MLSLSSYNISKTQKFFKSYKRRKRIITKNMSRFQAMVIGPAVSQHRVNYLITNQLTQKWIDSLCSVYCQLQCVYQCKTHFCNFMIIYILVMNIKGSILTWHNIAIIQVNSKETNSKEMYRMNENNGNITWWSYNTKKTKKSKINCLKNP